MLIVRTKKELAKQLEITPPQKTLGLVPTMGALHKGHESLVRMAVEQNDATVVSIFVNPTQFDKKEDLEKYPKTLQADIALLQKVSDEIIVFAPSAEEIYGTDIKSKAYDFDGLDQVMEGAFRDDHFNGVGTIVETLFQLVKPHRAYFGEKDFQQLQIIKKLVQIRNIPVEIVPCPIVREANGLALSSRNERLSPELRQKAGLIYQTLKSAKKAFGTKSVDEIKEQVKESFAPYPDLQLEYIEISEAETLVPAREINGHRKYRAFIAVYADGVRLIDNIALN
ncbi:pantoate--beta-alanine ligase [Pseudozobellia thermophila]|uniref:Pantothenate synthetase n=1 Tax=Pseudozobellia thermophila TaxID=192903 RepID=A0A1M6ARE0_9FLAO|nr:pantoate--beta-alanine ligase [Pseudozobellia thermophila]SHI38981.1 pantoate--beta-alanine ligase [Pseudozobellia thermophila]